MLEEICLLAREAGSAIIEVYQQSTATPVVLKADQSPVTAADLAAHQCILQGLIDLDPTIPVLSEEDPPAWDIRRQWQRYWLVDPLDGTKEFIQRNGEFTVNIALIENGIPILGVVYVPASDVMYAATQTQGWKEEHGLRSPLKALSSFPPRVVMSRSHPDKALANYLTQLGEYESLAVGSSLKFCLIAEGKAQLYPRFGPTSVWDTAAGQAIACAAGAKVLDWEGNPLTYHPRKSLINPGFCVSFDGNPE